MFKKRYFLLLLLLVFGYLGANHRLPESAQVQKKLNTLLVSALNPKNADVLTVSAQKSADKIRDAEVALAKAIQEDGVPKAQLNRFYRAYRNISDDAKVLSQFPAKTAEAFRLLHAALKEEIDRQMKKDGKGAEFFKAPVEKSLSPQMVSHAIALERLPVSEAVSQYIEQIAQAPEVTETNIHQVAMLCDKNWPCIEKAAYTWIKSNHLLSPEQHQLIQQFNTGS